jgi:hypothetical protein
LFITVSTMPHRPSGWHHAGYKTKRARIQELLLDGKGTKEIIATLDSERPGSRTFPSEISAALAPLVKKRELPSRRTQRAVVVDGVRYPSLTDAAHAHGISVEGARKRLAKGHPGWGPAGDA